MEIGLDIGFKFRPYFKKKLEIDRSYVFELYLKYIENLGEFLTVSCVEWQFLSALNFTDLMLWSKNDDGNSYVEEGVDKLGKSILKNGSFFPIIYTMDFAGLRLLEGFHRVYALQSLKSSKKILGIRYPAKSDKLKEYMFWMIYPDEYIYSFPFKYDYSSKDLYRVTLPNTYSAYRCLIIYSMFLSEMMYKVRPNIQGAACINDKSCFISWYYNQIRSLKW